jgi:hypothetical protein
MRYLYGDSVPFPPQYDFLAALEAFCIHAARVVRLDAESKALRKTSEESAIARIKDVDELDAFHREALGALKDGARDTTQALVQEYVRQLSELAQRMADDARRNAIATSDREAQSTRAECDRRRAEAREALEKLLIAVRLPVVETHITMSLIEGRNDFSATFSYEGGLLAAFALSADEVEEWKAPRHVRDLAQNVSLPVGVKRSLFKRTVAPETIVLDEYFLSGFDLRDDRAELRLRKRPEQADSLIFTLKRTEDRLSAEVHHPDDAEAESGLPAVLDQSSATEVERLWQLLRTACAPVLARKKGLTRLALAGDDVFEGDLGTSVVALVIGVIAPIVAEVARRSPNQHELSLKVENDTGRREEIYLRKAQLISALASVTPKARRVFDPLGLIASDPRESIESLTDEAIIVE